MKILIPIQKGINYPYLNEIIKISSNEYVFESIYKYNPSIPVVNIHWPEAIFSWKEPTQQQISELENFLLKWKETALLVYTKHDLSYVKGGSEGFDLLYELIENYTDVFIHLGEYSKNIYSTKYPNANHEIIMHPIFSKTFPKISKKAAREELHLPQSSLVITVPGQIRSKQERDLVLSAFKKIKITEAILIVTNMRNEFEYDFPGRIALKKFFDIGQYTRAKFEKKFQPPRYLFSYSPLSNKDFALRIAAADVIFIPRINLLNTGNVMLGLTFNKITVGPAIGNIKEQLVDHDLPAFDPKVKKSVIQALSKGIKLSLSGKEPHALVKYSSRNVAMAYDNLFQKLTGNEA